MYNTVAKITFNYLPNLIITFSMTENGDPYENAIAERVNGILKLEFNLKNGFPVIIQAEEAIRQAINIYTLERIHISNGFITPEALHGPDKTKKMAIQKA